MGNKTIFYVKQEQVEKYGRVPPRSPVVIAKRRPATNSTSQSKSIGTSGKRNTDNK